MCVCVYVFVCMYFWMMVPLNRLIRLKKFRNVVFSILILNVIFILFHLSNIKLYQQFNWDSYSYISNKKIILPTTSHLNDGNKNTVLNLKYFQTDFSNILDLREQLSLNFPYDPTKQIPRNIWQTWKYSPESPKFSSSFRKYQSLWSKQNQANWHYSLIKDEEMNPFLETFYGEVPLVIEAFNAMPNIILKADFFRYLVLYARGGIYTDMDTFPLKNINDWPSLNKTFLNTIQSVNNNNLRYKNLDENNLKSSDWNEPGFVVGIEADPDRQDWNDWYARRIQFCQWTIQSKPGHPILRELIINITSTTLLSVDQTGRSSKYKNLIDLNHPNDYNVNYRDKRLFDKNYDHAVLKKSDNVDGTDIMNWTGPGIFSDIIFEYMNNLIATNKNIAIQNPNLEINNSDNDDSENETNDKSTKKFYRKIVESLQSFNKIPWEFFSLITKPVIVDDIMVLPITCFSPGVNNMEAKDDTDEMAFVKHMFSGTWKATADRNAKKD